MVNVTDLLTDLPATAYTWLAGQQYSNNQIQEVMVMASPDVENWVLKGELILTSLYGTDWASRKAIVDELVSHQAAGMLIKLNQFLEQVPTQLVRYCEQQGLPLIQIRHITYREIIQAFSQLQQQELSVLGLLFNSRSTRVLKALCNNIATSEQIEFGQTQLGLSARTENYVLLAVEKLSQIGNLTALVKALQNVLPRANLVILEDCLALVLAGIDQLAVFKRQVVEPLANLHFVGSAPVSLVNLNLAYEQALGTRKIALARPLQAFTSYEDLGIEKLFLTAGTTALSACLVTPALNQMYDQEPELFESLLAYFRHNQNITRAADAIFIHPKTLRYRLNKIEAALGVELANGEQALELNMAVHFLDLKGHGFELN
ncbi:hypothetical protein FC83_GL001510 [Agrilactobacillus composti DSM 18527 = JCM 14202]|uniref:PucR family transcriptional regulator n=1 Tax=Agrilactobacillus composti DSM 18527 = JCM 14202 TaxID=1423734 RepID=X0PD45_9LACO|nr:PucR family transcriptional regulator [Agrilactobacillus composti]KRM30379.1 hypothetical protein FC83_GL001510 [Agrilactobacillus composti DSM 18527 = JCM 14202]GAF38844.1 transcriptional regulatory protein [Agrilactobacillus composti DSM 18527 = JCM 14202]